MAKGDFARIDAVLWAAFAVMSAVVFAIGSTEKAMDHLVVYYTTGLIDAVLAATLLWRHGLTLATPVVLAVYVFSNKWFLFLLFLSIIF